MQLRDLVRRKIRRLQNNEAGWITNIPRYADLFDKYSQVFSDSTGFCGITSHRRKITEFRLSQGPLVAKFLGCYVILLVVEFSSSMPNHSHIWNEM